LAEKNGTDDIGCFRGNRTRIQTQVPEKQAFANTECVPTPLAIELKSSDTGSFLAVARDVSPLSGATTFALALAGLREVGRERVALS
jgi:hypothetical protein